MSNERYLKIVTDLTVELPVTSERKWASFQVTRHTQLVGWVDRRLFHSDNATIFVAKCICCVWNFTWHRNDEEFFWGVFLWGGVGVCVCVCVGGGGGGGGGGGHSSPVYLVFGVVYRSRPPRVLRRFTALLCGFRYRVHSCS